MIAEEKQIIVSYLMNILQDDIQTVYNMNRFSYLHLRSVIASISIIIKKFGIDLTDENISQIYEMQKHYAHHSYDSSENIVYDVYLREYNIILENILYKFFDGNLEKYLGQAGLHSFGI